MQPPHRALLLLLIPAAAACLSQCAEVLQKDLTHEQVTLTAPVDKLVSADSTEAFYWQQLEDATSYELQVVSPRFDSIVRFICDTTVPVTNFQVGGLKHGAYQWRVRALNSGSTSLFSDLRSFSLP